MTSFEDLRALGLNLIPCHPKSKLPKFKWDEFKNTKYTGPLGNDNAAVICGITSGNLIVIDVDKREYITKFFENFEGVKLNTIVVETGKGYHIYCHPKGNMIPIIKLIDSNNQPVGELRGQGGYVIAPGSIHDVTGKEYKIISSSKEICEVDIDGLLTKLSAVGIRPQSNLPPINEMLKDVPIGNRNNATYKYAAHLISQGFNYEATLAAVTVWSEKLGFAKVHVSAVKSAWKRVKRPDITQNQEVPIVEESEVIKFGNITMKDEGKELITDCLIAVTDEIKAAITEVEAECETCGALTMVKEDGYINPTLPKCLKCKVKMKWNYKTQKTTNTMDVLLEEFLEETSNNTPRRYTGIVNGGNVFKTFSGQRKRITAEVKAIANRDPREKSDIVFHIKEVEDLDEPADELPTKDEITKWQEMAKNDPTYYKRLVLSYQPEIFCDPQIKKMLLLCAIGGSKGVTRRTNSHSLLIGNPSRGKSELLKFMLLIIGKSTYVIAMSSSKAGLASGMVKINGRMVARAGILVRYSGGLVVFDELDKAQDEDKNATLECMEQQTVTLVKSGVEEHLTAKTTIVAAANPKYGRWDNSLGIMENIDLDAYMVSRYDIIWKFGERTELETSEISLKRLGLLEDKVEPLLSPPELKRFLNYMKTQNPQINREGKMKIHDFYMKMSKKNESDMTLPMEDRQEEGLMRFTCASAKAKFKVEADENDVEDAIQLYRDSLESFGISTKGDVQQMKLTDSIKTKEQDLREIIHQNMDEDEEFLEKDVTRGWANTKHFKSEESARKEFEKWIGDKILKTESGRYRLARIT